MAVMGVLEEQRVQDFLTLEQLRGARWAADPMGANTMPPAQNATDGVVHNCLNEASLVRLRHSLLLIAEKVAIEANLAYNPHTILSWVRQFRTLDGHLNCDDRVLYEGTWILSEEDPEMDLVN